MQASSFNTREKTWQPIRNSVSSWKEQAFAVRMIGWLHAFLIGSGFIARQLVGLTSVGLITGG
jgi:hypothetical protein